MQTPPISPKILRCASYFQLSSRCLDNPMKHCLSCLIYYMNNRILYTVVKGPGKRGHIVLLTQTFPHLPARATFAGTQKCFSFCSETCCVRNKCFPVCAAQETSWATMCPQQCVLVYQGLKALERQFEADFNLVNADASNRRDKNCHEKICP